MTDPKSAVSVAEMARLVGLSRGRFHQLVGTTFPCPVYDLRTRRPFYTAELQQVCLSVRNRNCGIDGKPVLFYAQRRMTITTAKPSLRKRPNKVNDHADLIKGLRSLGLGDATAAQVATAVKVLYPNGVQGVDQGEVLRMVFLAIKRRNSADNLP